jgi:uncharacterized phage infection (PIP) family protein YhgE
MKKTLKRGGGLTTPLQILWSAIVEAARFPVGGFIITPTVFSIMLYFLTSLHSASNRITEFVTTVNNTIQTTADVTEDKIKLLLIGLSTHKEDLESYSRYYDSLMDGIVSLFGSDKHALYAINRRMYSSTVMKMNDLKELLKGASTKINGVYTGIITSKYSEAKLKNMLTKISDTSEDLSEKSTKAIEKTNDMKDRAEKINEKVSKGCPEGKVVNPTTLRCIKNRQ